MLKRFKYTFILGLLCLGKLNAQQTYVDTIKKYELCYYSQCFGYDVTSISNERLFDCIDLWTGTRYKFSGNDLDGIDCSRFVMMVYNYVYGKPIDGSADELYNKCKKIKKENLQQGDLVFFRTSKRRISHVGVYVGNNRFAHASTSSGIIISDLDEPYYSKHFAGCGIIED